MSNGQAGKNCYLSDFFRNVLLEPVTINGKITYRFNAKSADFLWNKNCEKQLSNLIVSCLKRKNLYGQSPKLLGYDDKTEWRKGSDAFEDLLQTVFCECVVKRAKGLHALARSNPKVTGFIKRNIYRFLQRKQREFDPVNANVFDIVRAASTDAVTKGKLEIELKGSSFSKKAVLVLNSNRNAADRRLIHKEEILYLFYKEEIRFQEDWRPQLPGEILPSFFIDFARPTRKKVSLPVSNARKKLLKMLENCTDKKECINVVINVEDIIEALKTYVNRSIKDKFNSDGGPNRQGEVVIEGEESEAVLTTQDQFTKDNSISRREAFDKLKDHVQDKINNNPQQRTFTKNNYLKYLNKFYDKNKELVSEGKPLNYLEIDSIKELTQLGDTQANNMRKEFKNMISESLEEIINEDENDLDFLR